MPTKDFSIRNDQWRVEACQEVLWREEDRGKSLREQTIIEVPPSPSPCDGSEQSVSGFGETASFV